MMKVLRDTKTGISRIINKKGEDIIPACCSIEVSKIGECLNLVVCQEASSNKIVALRRRFLVNFDTEKYIELLGPSYCTALNENVYKVNVASVLYYFDENLNLLANNVGYVKSIGSASTDKYLVVQMEDGKYICDLKFRKIAGPFLDVSDLDEYGQTIVTIIENGVRKHSALLLVGDKYHKFGFCVECDSLKIVGLGVCKIVQTDRCGIIDWDGKEILPIQYHDITYDCGIETAGLETYYILKNNGKFGLSTKEGKVILGCEYDNISRSGSCMLASQTQPDGKVQLITVFGEKIVN